MLPGNTLSSSPVPEEFLYDMGVEFSPVLDYKAGGIALQDPTKGLDYQIWRGRLINPETNNSTIILDGRFSPEHILITYPNMYEFNFTFDFSMRPMAVFLAKEIQMVGNQEQEFKNCYLYWFDNTLGRYDLIFLGNVIRTPKILIDDPREEESNFYSLSDVCLFYWESGNLYVRYLRDRFTERYLLKRNVPYIDRVGMNKSYRMQWDMVREAEKCESTGVKNDCTNKP